MVLSGCLLLLGWMLLLWSLRLLKDGGPFDVGDSSGILSAAEYEVG